MAFWPDVTKDHRKSVETGRDGGSADHGSGTANAQASRKAPWGSSGSAMLKPERGQSGSITQLPGLIPNGADGARSWVWSQGRPSFLVPVRTDGAVGSRHNRLGIPPAAKSQAPEGGGPSETISGLFSRQGGPCRAIGCCATSKVVSAWGCSPWLQAAEKQIEGNFPLGT